MLRKIIANSGLIIYWPLITRISGMGTDGVVGVV